MTMMIIIMNKSQETTVFSSHHLRYAFNSSFRVAQPQEIEKWLPLRNGASLPINNRNPHQHFISN